MVRVKAVHCGLIIFYECLVLLLSYTVPLVCLFSSVNSTFSSDEHFKHKDAFLLLIIIPESVIDVISNLGFSLRSVR